MHGTLYPIMTAVRKGQAPGPTSRQAFHTHFQSSFFDPAFDAEREAISRLEEIAWDGYSKSRKSPRTEKAGPGFADPDYGLSVEWRDTRDGREFFAALSAFASEQAGLSLRFDEPS